MKTTTKLQKSVAKEKLKKAVQMELSIVPLLLEDSNGQYRVLKGNSEAMKAKSVSTTKVKTQTKRKTIEQRRADFANTLLAFKDKYTNKMLKDFYLYWTEPLLKYPNYFRQEQEQERVEWDLERRLSTWHGISKKMAKNAPFELPSNLPPPFNQRTKCLLTLMEHRRNKIELNNLEWIVKYRVYKFNTRLGELEKDYDTTLVKRISREFISMFGVISYYTVYKPCVSQKVLLGIYKQEVKRAKKNHKHS